MSAATESAPPPDVAPLADLLRGRRVVVLTGAGVSTESGIPDYRSPESAAKPRRPIHGPEFVRSEAVRRRYWARSVVGWDRFRHARPGLAHLALARLEAAGAVHDLLTQNVDRLHSAAGSRRVIELHGALAEVGCLACGATEERDSLQVRMRRDNDLSEHLAARASSEAPDGDAEVSDAAVDRFVIPACLSCGGTLKPRVVFFGDSVPRAVVDDAFARVEAADALLIAGTSLAVFSGYRFLLRAAERGKSIAIINRGAVRGEERATLKIEASTGATLDGLARELAGGG